MNGNSLSKFSKQIQNPFWADVLRAFASVSDGIIIETENINRCGLFYSNVTKFGTTCINDWRRKGLCYISDIIDVEGQILTFQQLKQIFEIRGSYLDYLGLIRSLPHDWKSMTGKCRAMYHIIHPQVELMLSKEKGAKYLYDIILKEKTKTLKNSWEQCWENRYGEINWVEVYKSIYQKSSVYYHILSYKIITRIIATNRMLHAIGIKDSALCERGLIEIETIEPGLAFLPAKTSFCHLPV